MATENHACPGGGLRGGFSSLWYPTRRAMSADLGGGLGCGFGFCGVGFNVETVVSLINVSSPKFGRGIPEIWAWHPRNLGVSSPKFGRVIPEIWACHPQNLGVASWHPRNLGVSFPRKP